MKGKEGKLGGTNNKEKVKIGCKCEEKQREGI